MCIVYEYCVHNGGTTIMTTIIKSTHFVLGLIEVSLNTSTALRIVTFFEHVI